MHLNGIASVRPKKDSKNSGLWQDHELVFPSKTGTLMQWSNLTKRNFKSLLNEVGLPQTVRF